MVRAAGCPTASSAKSSKCPNQYRSERQHEDWWYERQEDGPLKSRALVRSRIGACIRRIVAVSKAETRSRRRDLATGTAGANRVLKEGRKMSYLTQQDLQNFGPELVDLAQRAAAQVVAPEMSGCRKITSGCMRS